MNIKPMLLRLQSALGQDNLSEQMLLHPGSNLGTPSDMVGNFVIGYNGSPNSQTALDFILWMAHQTRLATQRQVTVHVVYVIDCYDSLSAPIASAPTTTPFALQNIPVVANCHLTSTEQFGFQCNISNFAGQKVAHTTTTGTQVAERQPSSLPSMLEQVDRILWQARCLSDEWRGSLEAHLRFGAVATELRQVVETEKADLLFLGCTDVKHPLVQQLAHCISCPILGIPTELEAG